MSKKDLDLMINAEVILDRIISGEISASSKKAILFDGNDRAYDSAHWAADQMDGFMREHHVPEAARYQWNDTMDAEFPDRAMEDTPAAMGELIEEMEEDFIEENEELVDALRDIADAVYDPDMI